MLIGITLRIVEFWDLTEYGSGGNGRGLGSEAASASGLATVGRIYFFTVQFLFKVPLQRERAPIS